MRVPLVTKTLKRLLYRLPTTIWALEALGKNQDLQAPEIYNEQINKNPLLNNMFSGKIRQHKHLQDVY